MRWPRPDSGPGATTAALAAHCRLLLRPGVGRSGSAPAGGGDGLLSLSPRHPRSHSEGRKCVFGDDANDHDTALECPSLFPANARLRNIKSMEPASLARLA